MKKTNRNVQTAMVYCGPDIPFTAKQFDSYTNGLPERLTLIMEEIPAVGSLIVPVERMAQTRAELMRSGSALQNIFAKAAEEIRRKEW